MASKKYTEGAVSRQVLEQTLSVEMPVSDELVRDFGAKLMATSPNIRLAGGKPVAEAFNYCRQLMELYNLKSIGELADLLDEFKKRTVALMNICKQSDELDCFIMKENMDEDIRGSFSEPSAVPAISHFRKITDAAMEEANIKAENKRTAGNHTVAKSAERRV
ncbi:MAG: hypothetical protein QM731_26015 [Chitinophagaceae bacterium]